MINELNKIKYKLETLQKHRVDVDNNLVLKQQSLENLNKEMCFVIAQAQYYKKAVDIVYERSIVQLKSLLNSALSTIFVDRKFEIDIVLNDKRGKSLHLTALEDGKPVNLKTGMGMGVLTVISAVLQMYYLQCKNSRILLLDEKYSAVSEEYVDAFFEFLSKMCKELQFRIILITHDKRFLQYADKKYCFNQGVVTCID